MYCTVLIIIVVISLLFVFIQHRETDIIDYEKVRLMRNEIEAENTNLVENLKCIDFSFYNNDLIDTYDAYTQCTLSDDKKIEIYNAYALSSLKHNYITLLMLFIDFGANNYDELIANTTNQSLIRLIGKASQNVHS